MLALSLSATLTRFDQPLPQHHYHDHHHEKSKKEGNKKVLKLLTENLFFMKGRYFTENVPRIKQPIVDRSILIVFSLWTHNLFL